jgi:hypothetical protein
MAAYEMNEGSAELHVLESKAQTKRFWQCAAPKNCHPERSEGSQHQFNAST